MLKGQSPALHVIVFMFIAYLIAGLGIGIYQWSVMAVVGEAFYTANFEDPRIVLSHNLFFQIFAFLISFMAMLNITGERFETVVAIGKTNMRGILITCGVFLAAMMALPLMEYINEPLSYLLSPAQLEREAVHNETMNGLLIQSNPIQFVVALFVMAVLPAICEELVFRGFLIRKMLDSGLTRHAAVISSALIFSLTHFQPMKFVSIFFLGLCLGYIYTYFKNIKYAMLLHFLVNGSQAILGFLVGSGVLDIAF